MVERGEEKIFARIFFSFFFGGGGGGGWGGYANKILLSRWTLSVSVFAPPGD